MLVFGIVKNFNIHFKISFLHFGIIPLKNAVFTPVIKCGHQIISEMEKLRIFHVLVITTVLH